MSGLTLPARRAGWSVHPERVRATDGFAWLDAQRWLRAELERLGLGYGPRLSRRVWRALSDTQSSLVHADTATFNRAVVDLRVKLQQQGCSAHTTGRALGLVGAAMARTVGKTPYNTQYLASWLILQGWLAEMATGEGKTLAAAMAAAVAALGQVPVHLLTANDYLVQRDSETFRPFYAALGLSVGCVLTGMTPQQRSPAYRSDITFVTAKELVFDYLKDHLAQGGEHDPRVLRAQALRAHHINRASTDKTHSGPLLPGLYMAIVDEADACLLDEAVMPLILAQPGQPVNAQAYASVFCITTQLQRGRDYLMLASQRAVRLTDTGRAQVDLGVRAALANIANTLTCRATAAALAPPQRAHELAEAALAARWLFRRDREYAVTPDGIQLIDEVTGRIADGRQWSTALQQMVELKEGLALKPPAVPAAQITFQRFFARCLHLGGMSGTLTEARHELRLLYGVGVAPVALARASRRRWLGEQLFVNATAKWSAVVEATAAMHNAGRPVLVGTDSVADSAHLSDLLTRAGIPHQVLNAVQDAHEADCIAQAGLRGAVTVATNMAGRGTDIHLDADAASAGGLHVIACMRNSARRIDRQLIGRCARHGDPGSAQRMVALDDVLVQRGLPEWLRRAVAATARRRARVPQLFALPLLALAQRKVEWHECQRRKLLRDAERQLGDLYGFAGTTE
jgi:preprotein translocase subunit SecA